MMRFVRTTIPCRLASRIEAVMRGSWIFFLILRSVFGEPLSGRVHEIVAARALEQAERLVVERLAARAGLDSDHFRVDPRGPGACAQNSTVQLFFVIAVRS